MYIEHTENRRAFFSDLYENARQSLQEQIEKLDLWHQQYKGSPKIDGSTEEACAVRNITYEIIESQVDSNIPAPKVDPKRYSEHSDRCAKSIERLCAQLRERLPFEALNDIDERYAYIFGGSVWLVEWDDCGGDAEDAGDVKISCLSPEDFIPQPGIYRIDDMEYCFLRYTTTRDELCRRYGAPKGEVMKAYAEQEDNISPNSDTVTVIVCYYRDEVGDICRFVWSGELTLEDSQNYFARKTETCKTCGKVRGVCACQHPDFLQTNQDYETLEHDIMRSDGSLISALRPFTHLGVGEPAMYQNPLSFEGVLLKPTQLPYYTPKRFPIVIRKNTSSHKQLLGQSDCEFLRPIQQQINKVESRILQKLMRSAITPIVPEDAQITLSNRIFGQVIKLRPGESAADYGTVDTTPDISKDIAQAERLYDHAKRLIGISDAYTGLDQSTMSGYSRQLQLSQSAGRLESKRRMKHSAYAEIDRLIFEYYLAYADEPRTVTYKDAQGRIHNAAFNRYDFLCYDAKTDSYYYDDSYLFSVDLNGTIEGQREVMWEKNLQNLQAGTLGDPTSPATLLRYWQNQERVHYPFARENVEYFQTMIQENLPSATQNEPSLAEVFTREEGGGKEPYEHTQGLGPSPFTE